MRVRHALPLFAALVTGCGSDEPAGPPDGRALFSEQGCDSCHELAAADATGSSGPTLEGADLSADATRGWIDDGGEGMPAYADRLSEGELTALAEFVARSSAGG